MKNYSIQLNGNEIAFNIHSLAEAEKQVERYRKAQASLYGFYNLNFIIKETEI